MLERPIENPVLAGAFEAFHTRFPESVLGASHDKGELRVRVRIEDLLAVLSWLKSDQGFKALVDIVALDRLHAPDGEGLRFRLIYQICQFPDHVRLHLVADIGEGKAAPSVVAVYRAADWAEREIFDMFGIRFDGHPGLRRIYLTNEFDGYPLRKDFPLDGRTDGV